MGKFSKKNKNKPKPDLSGEALMIDALKRIEKINGKLAVGACTNTFDEKITKRNISKIKHLTNLPQDADKTPSETGVPLAEEKTVSSQDDYVDYKVDKKIFNFEKKLFNEISKEKSSIQKWGIGLVVGAIIAAGSMMVVLQLFSTQQIKDFINTNFTEKFDRAISETNKNLLLLQKEQNDIKITIDSLQKRKSKKP
jgi:hypothetical protein